MDRGVEDRCDEMLVRGDSSLVADVTWFPLAYSLLVSDLQNSEVVQTGLHVERSPRRHGGETYAAIAETSIRERRCR